MYNNNVLRCNRGTYCSSLPSAADLQQSLLEQVGAFRSLSSQCSGASEYSFDAIVYVYLARKCCSAGAPEVRAVNFVRLSES